MDALQKGTGLGSSEGLVNNPPNKTSQVFETCEVSQNKDVEHATSLRQLLLRDAPAGRLYI
jgi:hypothetical protein